MQYESKEKTSWFDLLKRYLIIQAIVGIVLFEWAYSKVSRFRDIDPKREEYHKSIAR